MNGHRRKPNARRRGTSSVEFALCFPVVISIVFATIELSRVQQLNHAVRQAAYEGARAGLTTDATAASAQQQATNMLTALGITGATVNVTPSTINNATQTVTVQVTVDVTRNGWLTWYFTGGRTITASVTLDSENKAMSIPTG